MKCNTEKKKKESKDLFLEFVLSPSVCKSCNTEYVTLIFTAML